MTPQEQKINMVSKYYQLIMETHRHDTETIEQILTNLVDEAMGTRKTCITNKQGNCITGEYTK